jgi:hypothetical protein
MGMACFGEVCVVGSAFGDVCVVSVAVETEAQQGGGDLTKISLSPFELYV